MQQILQNVVNKQKEKIHVNCFVLIFNFAAIRIKPTPKHTRVKLFVVPGTGKPEAYEAWGAGGEEAWVSKENVLCLNPTCILMRSGKWGRLLLHAPIISSDTTAPLYHTQICIFHASGRKVGRYFLSDVVRFAAWGWDYVCRSGKRRQTVNKLSVFEYFAVLA